MIKKITCKNCNYYRTYHNVDGEEHHKGLCLLYGHHIFPDDEICVDFER